MPSLGSLVFKPMPRNPSYLVEARDLLWNSGWSEIHEAMYEARRARGGDLWTNRQKQKLEAKRRAALTYNIIRPHEKVAAGIQLQNALDVKAYPVKSGTVAVAGKLTKLLKYHSMTNLLPWTWAECYHDIWGDGLMVLEERRVVLEDPFGEQQTSRGNAFQHLFSLDFVRPDQEDIPIAIKMSWFTPEEILSRWGLHNPNLTLDDLKGMVDDRGAKASLAPGHPLDLVFAASETGHHELSAETVSQMHTKGKVRVLEGYWREDNSAIFLYVAEIRKPINMTGKSVSDIAQLKAMYEQQGLTVLVLRQTVPTRVHGAVAGISDAIWLTEPVMYGPNHCPWTYGLGHRIGSMLSGEALDLIDPARGFSKGKSLQLELLAKSANKGIVTYGDDWTPEEKKTVNDIADGKGGALNIRNATKAVSVIDWGAVSGDSYRFSVEEFNLVEKMASSPPSLRGEGSGSHQSGSHAAQMIGQGMLGSEPIRNNFHLALKISAEKTIREYQWYEGGIPFRMLPILEDDGSQQEAQFNVHMGEAILDNLQIGQYAVSIDLTSYTATDRRAQLTELANLMQMAAQAGLPPQMILQLSDHPEAAKLSEYFTQQQEAANEQALLASITGEKQG